METKATCLLAERGFWKRHSCTSTRAEWSPLKTEGEDKKKQRSFPALHTSCMKVTRVFHGCQSRVLRVSVTVGIIMGFESQMLK